MCANYKTALGYTPYEVKKYVRSLGCDDVCVLIQSLGIFSMLLFSRIIGFQLDPLSCSFMCECLALCNLQFAGAVWILIESAAQIFSAISAKG
jgi:hypothetical protein